MNGGGRSGGISSARVVQARRDGVLLEQQRAGDADRTARTVRFWAFPYAGVKPGDRVEFTADPHGAGNSLCWFGLPAMLGSLGFALGTWFFAQPDGLLRIASHTGGLLMAYLVSGIGFGAGLLVLFLLGRRILARRYDVTIVRKIERNESDRTSYR